jgi:hypothetical protein
MDAAGLRGALAAVLRSLVPELFDRAWPQPARVLAVRASAGRSERTEPRLVADVEMLGWDGSPDAQWPTLAEVPLPALWPGPGRGIYAQPAVGSIVRVAFEGGDRSRPYVESATPAGWDVEPGAADEIVVRNGDCTVRVQADRIEIEGPAISGLGELGGAARVVLSASGISLAGGGPGEGVITERSICPYTGLGHMFGSRAVKAGGADSVVGVG